MNKAVSSQPSAISSPKLPRIVRSDFQADEWAFYHLTLARRMRHLWQVAPSSKQFRAYLRERMREDALEAKRHARTNAKLRSQIAA